MYYFFFALIAQYIWCCPTSVVNFLVLNYACWRKKLTFAMYLRSKEHYKRYIFFSVKKIFIIVHIHDNFLKFRCNFFFPKIYFIIIFMNLVYIYRTFILICNIFKYLLKIKLLSYSRRLFLHYRASGFTMFASIFQYIQCSHFYHRHELIIYIE